MGAAYVLMPNGTTKQRSVYGKTEQIVRAKFTGLQANSDQGTLAKTTGPCARAFSCMTRFLPDIAHPVGESIMMEDRWDFFLSYTSTDRQWAEWIAWELEAASYRVLVQAWDFVPGSHWMTRMDSGLQRADRTVAILSHAYLESVYGRQEWEAAYRADPDGFTRKLIPIRVEDCPRPGLLGGVVSFDLFGYDSDAARSHLLDTIKTAVSGRAKPFVAPVFPAASAAHPADSPLQLIPPGQSSPSAAPAFPGLTTTTGQATRLLLADVTPWHRGRWRVLLAAVIVAVTLNSDPSSEDLSAASRTLASQATRAQTTDRALSLRLAVAAYRLAPTPQARAALLSTPAILDHPGPVKGVAFSPDGTTLATVSTDKTARLWDITDSHQPHPLATLTGHIGTVWDVAFSRDGTTLATVSADHTARLWDIDPAGLARRACATTAGRITPDEWRRYLPNLTYRQPCS